jgi:hypothetical protein
MSVLPALLRHQEAMSDIAWRDDMIRELREALKFYADEKNHHRKWPCQSLVDVDSGKTARDALGEKKR